MRVFQCLECGEILLRNEVYRKGRYYECISCLGVAEEILGRVKKCKNYTKERRSSDD